MIEQSCYSSLKERNRQVLRDEMARRAARLSGRPRILFVELTRYCNLACPMCRNPGEVGLQQTMTAGLFERVAEELFPCAEVVDLRGWGESLILPEWTQRLKTAVSYGCEIRIVTNLSFDRPGVLEALADSAAYVGISLDGASESVVQGLRRGAKLDRIRSNLLYLGMMYKAKGISSRLRLYVTCQSPNLAELGDIIDIAAKAGVSTVMLTPVTVDTTSPLSISHLRPDIEIALNQVSLRARHHNITVLQTANLWAEQHLKEDTSPCIHPWAYCYITFDGRVGFCDHLIGPHGDPFIMGDLRQQSFEEIWNGEKWIGLREEHLGARRHAAPHFAECSWCYKNRFSDFEELIESSSESDRCYVWPSGIPKP